ncbi:MAG: diguanylate cyclase [Gammaproteobacteria bacterium]|nr:diguanylate cyclase [Gammaproteobacteria bacterium]
MIIYADLNCPYCYALNEQLEQLKIADLVDWRPVEHAPDMQAYSFSSTDEQELIKEVNDVHSKAPDITLSLPSIRPNSRLANELLAKVKLDHPKKERQFRTAVFRSLWIHDQNFSSLHVLDALLLSVGLPQTLTGEAAVKNLSQWRREWEFGGCARNIPCMESSKGFKMLGLPPFEQLKSFLTRGHAEITDFQDAACIGKQRYTIAFITDDKNKLPKPTLLETIANYHAHPSVEALIEHAQDAENLDLIIINNLSDDPMSIIRKLKHTEVTQHIPVALLSNDNNDAFHIEAYRAGISDIFSVDINDEILGHRLSQLLRSKRNIDNLYLESRIDALTELHNRREFDVVLEREWKQRLREEQPLSLLLIDLDHFKLYNDTYGHAMGDEALRRFASVLKSCVSRPTDLPARYGGEEFAIILPNTGLAGAKKIAAFILKQTVMQNIKHETSTVCPYLTASIGIAVAVPTSKLDCNEFVNVADKALYKAKERGRNRIEA